MMMLPKFIKNFALSYLTDCLVSNVQNGQILRYSAANSKWTNVAALFDAYNGTTNVMSGMRKVFVQGTTDANGKVTVNLTTTAVAGGPALFSSIVGVNAIAVSASTNIYQRPLCQVESITSTQLVIQTVIGVTQTFIALGTINTLAAGPAGNKVFIEVTGMI